MAASVDDMGRRTPVVKTLAHATTTDIDAGSSTWWEKKGNDLADKFAKLGAD